MAKTVEEYHLFECTILIVIVIANYAWANINMYINMLQEEGYWSCPPDHHMWSRFKFMAITILY